MEKNLNYNEIPDIEVLFELADLFKVFGDSTRLRIMVTISENEMSVLNIAETLNMEQFHINCVCFVKTSLCVCAERVNRFIILLMMIM